jgi:hypothetical protein
MNNKFDELAKSLAGPSSRRQALKKFSVGLAGMALACFGLANKAEAGPAKIPSRDKSMLLQKPEERVTTRRQ